MNFTSNNKFEPEFIPISQPFQNQKITQNNLPLNDKISEKQKKLEYQNVLKRQMEERKERQDEEKKRRIEEERRIEEQYRIMIEKEKEKDKEIENQKKIKQNNMDSHNHQNNGIVNNNFKQTNNNMILQNNLLNSNINSNANSNVNNNPNTNLNNINTNINPNSNNNIHPNMNVVNNPININTNNNIPSITQDYFNFKEKLHGKTNNDNQDYYNHPHFENSPYSNQVEQFQDNSKLKFIKILIKSQIFINNSYLLNLILINFHNQQDKLQVIFTKTSLKITILKTLITNKILITRISYYSNKIVIILWETILRATLVQRLKPINMQCLI